MQEQKFIVQVTDHSHTGEPEGEYIKGEYSTSEEAVGICKKIIEESLDELYGSHMSEDDLMKRFVVFGLEAYCEGFDSFGFAKECAAKRCLNG